MRIIICMFSYHQSFPCVVFVFIFPPWGWKIIPPHGGERKRLRCQNTASIDLLLIEWCKPNWMIENSKSIDVWLSCGFVVNNGSAQTECVEIRLKLSLCGVACNTEWRFAQYWLCSARPRYIKLADSLKPHVTSIENKII